VRIVLGMRPDELRMLRRQLGLTQAELAAALRVTMNTVARWEQGRHAISPLAEGALSLLRLQHGATRKSRRKAS